MLVKKLKDNLTISKCSREMLKIETIDSRRAEALRELSVKAKMDIEIQLNQYVSDKLNDLFTTIVHDLNLQSGDMTSSDLDNIEGVLSEYIKNNI